MLQVGSARIDENGNICNGSAGDQTGREVCIEPYYVHKQGWNVIRPKDPDLAYKIAKSMIEACNNNNIGYDQYQRETIVPMFKKYGSLKKIAEKCECDCSKLVEMCVWQATGKDPGNFTTGNAVYVLNSTGNFKTAKPVTSSTELFDGDILCTKTKGHIVVVVSGNPRTKEDKPKVQNEDSNNKKRKAIATGNVYIRAKADIKSKAIGVLTKDSICELTGVSKINNGITWVKIKANGVVGYCSGKYLKDK